MRDIAHRISEKQNPCLILKKFSAGKKHSKRSAKQRKRMDRTSSNTRVTLDLGTGEQCVERPPNLSHLSDAHLEGLRNAVNEELENRREENSTTSFYRESADYDGMLGMTDATIKMKKHTYFSEDSDRDDYAR